MKNKNKFKFKYYNELVSHNINQRIKNILKRISKELTSLTNLRKKESKKYQNINSTEIMIGELSPIKMNFTELGLNDDIIALMEKTNVDGSTINGAQFKRHENTNGTGTPNTTSRSNYSKVKRNNNIIIEENFTVTYDSQLITESQTSINMEKIIAAQSINGERNESQESMLYRSETVSNWECNSSTPRSLNGRHIGKEIIIEAGLMSFNENASQDGDTYENEYDDQINLLYKYKNMIDENLFLANEKEEHERTNIENIITNTYSEAQSKNYSMYMQGRNLIKTQNAFATLEDQNKTIISSNKASPNKIINETKNFLSLENRRNLNNDKQIEREKIIRKTYNQRKKHDKRENLFITKKQKPKKKQIDKLSAEKINETIFSFKNIKVELELQMPNLTKTKEELAKEIRAISATLVKLKKQYETLESRDDTNNINESHEKTSPPSNKNPNANGPSSNVNVHSHVVMRPEEQHQYASMYSWIHPNIINTYHHTERHLGHNINNNNLQNYIPTNANEFGYDNYGIMSQAYKRNYTLMTPQYFLT